jgi:hypothetical protein
MPAGPTPLLTTFAKAIQTRIEEVHAHALKDGDTMDANDDDESASLGATAYGSLGN